MRIRGSSSVCVTCGCVKNQHVHSGVSENLPDLWFAEARLPRLRLSGKPALLCGGQSALPKRSGDIFDHAYRVKEVGIYSTMHTV